MKFTIPFILASASPRRIQLLTSMGYSFTSIPANINEASRAGESPMDLAERLAAEKAGAVSASHPDSLILGADTIVVLDSRVLGKPSDEEDAVVMLQSLSGRTHEVITGISMQLGAAQRRVTTSETTQVTFAPLSNTEIERYASTGSPLDKAGAYGIQDDHGAYFVSGISGDYYTVMGLPLHLLYQNLHSHFGDLIV